MKKIVTIFLGVALTIPTIKAQWNVNTIGTMPNANAMSITVADGRNDNTERVYSASDSEVYEWTHNLTNGNWASTLVYTILTTPELVLLSAGDGRNDGVTRLYFTNFEYNNGGVIYEATWNGSSWNVVGIATSPTQTFTGGITVGNGRNDGSNRIYTCGSYGLYEYSWNGSSWTQLTVQNNWGEMYPAIGDARGDGVSRVVNNASCTYETSWNGSSFSSNGFSNCSNSQSSDAVEIGDGRNDGVNRVYVNEETGGRYEYTWNGSSYTVTTIRSTAQRGDIHLAALKADKKNRLYMTNAFHFGGPATGNLLEYEWNNSTNQWDSISVVALAITGASAYLEAGNGRNDDTIRLYTPNFATGAIYEITAANPNYVGLSTSIDDVFDATEIVVAPNPSNGYFTIKMNGTIENKVDLVVYNLLGKVVVNVSNVDISEPYSLNMTTYPKGIYILKLTDKSKLLSTQKIIID